MLRPQCILVSDYTVANYVVRRFLLVCQPVKMNSMPEIQSSSHPPYPPTHPHAPLEC